MAIAARADPDLLSVDALTVWNQETLTTIITSPDPNARLSRIDERAGLLRDLGQWMRREGMGNAQAIFDRADGHIDRERPVGIAQLLSSTLAYSDPVRKKTMFFLALMQNSGGWKYRDPTHLGPPVDYHEVRGHLRCGTIVITDPALLSAVQSGEDVGVDGDLAIRREVYAAIMQIAEQSGYTPSQLHYFFWNLFRSCCQRATTHCYECVDCSLVDRYAELTRGKGTQRCAVAELCSSRGAEQKLLEHNHDTHFY